MSDVVPEQEPSPFGHDAPVHELTTEDADKLRGHSLPWPECEFDGCSSPTSFQMMDRFGFMHKSCTACKDDLERWVRIHNGWDVEAADDGSGPTLP